MEKSKEYPTIIIYSNFGYIHFALNCLISLNRVIKNHPICFYCLDNDIYNHLIRCSFPNLSIQFVLWNSNNISKNFQNYGSYEYNKITHTKMNILRDAIEKFNFIHFIDSDVVCIHEPPIEIYKKYEKYDIMFQYDCADTNPPFDNWICTGNTTFRNTEKTLYLLNKISEYQLIYPNLNDQECLRKYFDDNNIKDIRDEKKVHIYVYPIINYMNGYMINNDIHKIQEDTYFFHANHVSGNNKKIDLLKKINQWFL